VSSQTLCAQQQTNTQKADKTATFKPTTVC